MRLFEEVYNNSFLNEFQKWFNHGMINFNNGTDIFRRLIDVLPNEDIEYALSVEIPEGIDMLDALISYVLHTGDFFRILDTNSWEDRKKVDSILDIFGRSENLETNTDKIRSAFGL